MMKIMKTKLKELVKDLQILNERPLAPRARGGLRHQAALGKELDAWMRKPLRSLPVPPIAGLSDAAKELIDKGQKDGTERDDMAVQAAGGGIVPFSNLKASQNEVGAAQSLRNTMAGIDGMAWDGIDWGDVNWLIEKMREKSPVFDFKNPIIIAQTSDGNVVLDGHHRWSQAMMINPNGKINTVGFKTDLSSDDMLQALHLGIYAVAGQANTKKAEGGNLFTDGSGQIRQYLGASERKVNPQTLQPDPKGVAPYVAALMKIKGIKEVEKGVDYAEAYAKNAIKRTAASQVEGAPSRTKMPQADPEVNPGATPDKVAAALKAGGVNYAGPFTTGDTSAAGGDEPEEERALTESKIYKRWKILAS